MTRLEESLHDWAIKPGHYDDDFPAGGGSSAQVFEVTNLDIASGTDWSGEGHNFGSFTADPATALLFKTYIEVAAPLEAGDDLFLDISNVSDYSVSTTVSEAHIFLGTSGEIWTYASNWFSSPPSADTSNAFDPLLSASVGFHGNRTTSPGTSLPVTVNLHTGGATTADITVVRARAAFLVI